MTATVRAQLQSPLGPFDRIASFRKKYGSREGIIAGGGSVEAPLDWTDLGVQIMAAKYFLDDELSVYEETDRVAWGIAIAAGRLELYEPLMDVMLSRKATFNSPVHFNVGRVPQPQCWACLIAHVGDSFDDTEETGLGLKSWWTTEADTFRHGSGSGVSVRNVREAGAPLRGSKAGRATGPLGFMRVADTIAGVVTSGGRTRRAAKMVIMDDRHPDLEAFIHAKVEAEQIARDLIAAGYDAGFNGTHAYLVPYQNANHSVNLTDEFVKLVLNNSVIPDWDLTRRLDGSAHHTVDARAIWWSIAEAAHACADPGVQFYDTINRWHTCKADGPIVASNPCSEYLFLENTCCNLASVNIKQFHLRWNEPDIAGLEQTVRTMIRAMDAVVDISSYPNPTVDANNREYRTLGLGYANIGALLMSHGIPYDSDDGRTLAAAWMSLIQAVAWSESASLADLYTPYPAFERNAPDHHAVIEMHARASEELAAQVPYVRNDIRPAVERIVIGANAIWDRLTRTRPAYRNAQVSVIAPTGTISFVLGCESTGIEPLMAIPGVGGVSMNKELAGGGDINYIAMPECVKEGRDYLIIYNRAGLPGDGLQNKAFETANGHMPLSPAAHVDMVAAVQPFVSGGISKTVNMPSSATVEDVLAIHERAWRSGVKSIAIYRDQSKSSQPVTVTRTSELVESTMEFTQSEVHHGDVPMYDLSRAIDVKELGASVRRPLPGTRPSVTHRFTVQDHTFYLTVGFFDDSLMEPGEIFLTGGKIGSAFAGALDMWCIAVSIDFQRGVPFTELRDKFRHQQFEPNGIVISDSPIKFCSSVSDYVFRWMDLHINRNSPTNGSSVTLLPQTPVMREVGTPTYGQLTPEVVEWRGRALMDSGPVTGGKECPVCQHLTYIMAGTCHMCVNPECLYSDGGCE